MAVGTPIPQYEKATSIPDNTTYIADMGDGSGTKGITQQLLTETVGKGLKVGNLEELQTENKESIVGAINEAAQSGGGGSSADILDTKEEIEANTESGKAAGAQAVKEMFTELNDNLGGCSIEQDGEDFYIVGADAVRKKLGDSGDWEVTMDIHNRTINNGTGATISDRFYTTLKIYIRDGKVTQSGFSEGDISIQKFSFCPGSSARDCLYIKSMSVKEI